jgi:glyoxylase I family protein
MNLSIEHIGIAAVDPVGLKDWYVRVLAAREVYTDGGNPPAFLLQVSGRFWIEVYAAEKSIRDTANNRLAGWRHVAIQVESIERARDELAGRGAEFEGPIKPAAGGGRVLFFKDGEGNLLHLVERPEGFLFADHGD